MSYSTYGNLGKTEEEPPTEQENSMVNIIQSQEHRENIIRNNRIVVVDNFTEWCGPCKFIAPQFIRMAGEFQGKVAFCKENVDQGFKRAENAIIRGVPCFHFYVNGQYMKDLTITGADIEKVRETLNRMFN
jgi:thioredoxin 1